MASGQAYRPRIDHIYNPDNQSKEKLIDSFVVRLKIFKRLFADIKNASMDVPEQDYLIEGKRGMGKTTLLLRLAYEIENDSDLSSCLIPIVFNEEEYGIRRLFKFWERIAILLEAKDDDFKGLFDEMDKSYDTSPNEEEYEYWIYHLLNKKLEEKGKKLILFIDNFGDIFAKFSKQEVQRLRTVLQTNTHFRIFAASSRVLEDFHDYNHPFYDFFKVVRLGGLDKKETEELLLKLGETYKQEKIKNIIQNQAGRVEALRRLTGGVIRTVVLLFEIFTDQEQGSAFSDLEAILDRVTPLYKHRVDDLPPQQQEIVEAIALAWVRDAVSVSEISQKTRIISKTVSAQLRQMEKNEIITKKLTHNKNHLYQISERFFNIWFLMRHGRKGDRRKVLWLVRFLEEWCDEGELVERTKKHIDSLKAGTYEIKGAFYMTQALALTKGLPSEIQDKLLSEGQFFFKNNNSEWWKYLSESDLKLREKGIKCFENREFEEALKHFSGMRSDEKGYAFRCNIQLKNYEEAEKNAIQLAQYNNPIGYMGLGMIYAGIKKDLEKARDFLVSKFEDTTTPVLIGVISFMFGTQILKEDALRFAKRLAHTHKNWLTSLMYVLSLLWNDYHQEANSISMKFIYTKGFIEDFNDNSSIVHDYFYLLIAKNQYQFLYNYLTSPQASEHNLKDKLKPIWYALMYYMQDEHPNEYLRMGEELEETVKEIIEKVEQMRIDYA